MQDYLWKISLGCIIASLICLLVFFLKIVVDFLKESPIEVIVKWKNSIPKR